MSDHTHHVYLNLQFIAHFLQIESDVAVGRPLFEPFPPKIAFRGYEPLQIYREVLSMRNNDKVLLIHLCSLNAREGSKKDSSAST